MHEQGIIYRDVKPGNIMLSESTPNAKACFIDFGAARFLPKTKEGKTEKVLDSVIGNHVYIAEEIRKEKPYDSKADMWSYGILAGNMVIGADRCPHGYTGGAGGFFKNCGYSKEDEYLAQQGIVISDEFKELLKSCLLLD